MKEDLEKLILDSYNIVRQNDRQILVADPREKYRLQKENSENWGYIQSYLNDYASLCEFLKQVALEDIVHIAATRFPEVATRLVVASKTKLVQSSASSAPTQPSKSGDLQFEIGYNFVQPYVSMNQEKLVQFLVNFNSHENVSFPQTDVVTHVCLVLDVSGSWMHRISIHTCYRPFLMWWMHFLIKIGYLLFYFRIKVSLFGQKILQVVA